jgi:hypothetical protein
VSNPKPNLRNIDTRNLSGDWQCVSDTKFSTKTLSAGVAPPQTDFFTTAPSADYTLDWYDAGNQLVSSAKKFCIQGLGVNVIGVTGAPGILDTDNVIQKGVLVLFAQQKEIGRFRLRNLNAAGGTFVAGAQAAVASNVGVVNGNPGMDPWVIADLLIDTNQQFKTTLLMPTVTTITLSAAVTVEVDLFGYELRPTA